MKRLIFNVSFVFLFGGLGGCSSITGTTVQPITLETQTLDGATVRDAQCKLSNAKGNWYLRTPGSVSIQRSNDDMQIFCEKDGVPPGRALAISATKPSMVGNAIFGGLVGVAIDHNSGSAYEYPSSMVIRMGIVLKIGPPDLTLDRRPTPVVQYRSMDEASIASRNEPPAARELPKEAAVSPAAVSPSDLVSLPTSTPSSNTPNAPAAIRSNTMQESRSAPDIADLQELLPKK